MNKFAQALVWDRETLGLTQTQLAEAIDISQQAIARWEGGQSFPRKAAYNKLIDYLTVRSEQMGRNCLTREAPSPQPGMLTEKIHDFLEEQEYGDGPKATPEHIKAITDFLDVLNKVKDETNPNIEFNLVENDILHFIEQMVEIPELKDRVTSTFGSNPNEKSVELWLKEQDSRSLKQWVNETRELLIKHHGFDSKIIESNRFEKYNHPDRIRKELEVNLHAAFRKSIDVMVQRGINSKQYDYFSQNVVAEFKMLHPYRPPSFNINQYAPAVVSLMLAKTMSFGQNKTYYLFLLHSNLTDADDLAVRMQSLQLDCSSLGIHVLLVKSIKQASTAIQAAEEAAEASANIRNSIRKT